MTPSDARPREKLDLERFVRERTIVAPVPLVPEVVIHQATELTPLWRATARALEGWDPSPFWAFPWAGGQALARFVLDRPALVRGKAVFDFASGSGLCAIAALRAGAARAVAADLDPFCAAAIHLNASLNGVAVEFRAGDAIGAALDGFDVVLAGDVYYERALAEGAHAWFRSAATRGVLVLAGDPGRIYSQLEGVLDRAVYDVPTTPEIEASDRIRTLVLEILPWDPAPAPRPP